MPRKQLVYLIGSPGSGKSTLMSTLTWRWTRTPAETGLTRDLLSCPVTSALEAVELGRKRPQFAGTDALGQSVIAAAIQWMIEQTETDLVFAEGARLGNRRFLASSAAAGYAVLLGFLDHPNTPVWRLARERSLGRSQNASWVAGRGTAARNLAGDPPDGVTVVSGHPDILRWEIEGLVQARKDLG